MKQAKAETLSQSPQWTEADIEQFCWETGVLTLVGVYGFRRAAGEEFKQHGFRLATINKDIDPSNLHKLSLYSIEDRQRLGSREAKKMVQCVMEKIGIRLKPDDCHADNLGRRLVVLVPLPRWTWPQL